MNVQISAKVGQRVLNTVQAAKALRVSPRTLEDWRISKKGPSFLKVNGNKNAAAFYRPEDLKEFAKAFSPRARVPSKSKKAKRK